MHSAPIFPGSLPSAPSRRRTPWQDDLLAQMLARHAGKRILIADASPADRHRLFDLLRDSRLELDFALDGADAVTRASDAPPCAILINPRLPVMDGLTASRVLRSLPFGRQLPIIAVSDEVLDDVSVRCFVAGIDDIVAKPLVADALHRCLLRWLDRRAVAAAPAWGAPARRTG